MRAYVPDYHLRTPRALSEILSLIASEPGVWKPFAGGTDLMVLFEAGMLPHKNYLNIWSLMGAERIVPTATLIEFEAIPRSKELPVSATTIELETKTPCG